MIRINLVAEKRPVDSGQSRFRLDEGKKIALGGSLIVLLSLAYAGWSYWSLDQRAQQVERDIDAARVEEQRLIQVISEVREFEARRGRLEQRVSLIEELRRGQTAPVHILDQVSRSLPDMVWLTKMTQTGYDLNIEGNCLSLTALSDFIGALEHSRYFARPVEIINSEVVAATPTSPELIKFVVKAGFQMSGLKTAAPPAAPAAKGAGRG
ncbi:MAG: PilN domain-containing protein [Acidobacteria bacterium]|nr:PilN domain-containing protein [Acidobacteriota bacterium]